MRRTVGRQFAGLCIVGLATNCGKPAPAPAAHPPAATVANAKPEATLTTVTLSPESEKHLALQVKKVAIETVGASRIVGAEAIVPPGRSMAVTAPIAGTLVRGAAAIVGPVKRGDVLFELTPLNPAERDLRSDATRLLQEAEARLTQATQRVQRLELLLKDGSTSVRAVEEAQADRAVATASAVAARQHLESANRAPVGADGRLTLTAPFDGFVTDIRVAGGQTVAAGTTVADIAQVAAPWIRASVFIGDLSTIDSSQPVSMAALGHETTGPWESLRRVTGPPHGDPSAASTGLYFEPARATTLRPGDRVVIRLPLKSATRAIVVPQSAVIYDINGGTWVYEQRAPNQFARRRVEIGGVSGSNLVVTRGLTEGVTIVTVGAAELYGTEFYVSK